MKSGSRRQLRASAVASVNRPSPRRIKVTAVPMIRELREATFFAGLRKAGVRDE
jgi:hypothetical protein